MPDSANAFKKSRILIVDDDLFSRTAFKDALDRAGFLTSTAPDGTSALACFEELRPDLVLLDLVMPGKDGFTTCRELRGLPGGEHVPILVITGLDDTKSIRHAFDAGATDFACKPINPKLVVHRVLYELRASQSVRRLAESEARLAMAQQIAGLGTWELNPLTGEFRGSESLLSILGIDKLSSFEDFLSVAYPQDKEEIFPVLYNAFINKCTCSLEFRTKHRNESVRTLHLLGSAHGAVSGKSDRIIGTLQDITQIRQVEDRLRMLKTAVDCLPVGITFTDVEGKIIYSNPAEAEMHGYTVEELLGSEARQFAPKSTSLQFPPARLEELRMWRRESANIRKNGEVFPVQLNSIAVKDAEGKCLGIITACEDITIRKEAEKKISTLAYYDSLTGLPNRAMFLDRLHHALARARRESAMVCILFIDLDNFKDVVDTKGHFFGDKLLREVAHRLSSITRGSDTLARLGGDEFVIVLNPVDTDENADIAAQRVLSVFSQPFSLEDQLVYCNASIGIARYPNDGSDVESLVKCADTAMYQAKEQGKGQYQFFTTAMNTRIMHRVALENGLQQGLERQEFVLYYQPKWDLKTFSIVGVEALLRWQNPEFGFMLPSEFISLAENSGLIVRLGEWILRTACTQARQWAMAGYPQLKVAVNISGQQLKQPDFLESVQRIVHETGVEPDALEFEFTETVIMERADNIIDIMKSLKNMGIQLSIDDFGTGYSSLSYLKHFPIDRLKIDRSFVVDVLTSSDDTAVVEAIIAMGHGLHLTVLAEGVETSHQVSFLTKHGCDEAQGFYLALPMTAADITANLRSSKWTGESKDSAAAAPALGPDLSPHFFDNLP